MPRLRRSDCSVPGIERRRSGPGFTYRWPNGRRVQDERTLERIRALAIPPAWREVWICPHGSGHLQAVGTDAAGRRQYRYHDKWTERRSAAKHERMLVFARSLPDARIRATADLSRRGMPKERALATAFRLLDLGFFRVGSESYRVANGTFGLATIRRDQVLVRGQVTEFAYRGKGGTEREQRFLDTDLARTVRTLLRRSDPADELLAWRDRVGWHDVRSRDINEYLRELTGDAFTAKDFRTWNATVLMAQALAVSQALPKTESSRKLAVARGVAEVAGYLGNTPAVARRSYIDPRLIDHYLDGVTVELAVLERSIATPGLAIHGALEKAVIDLLVEPRRTSQAA